MPHPLIVASPHGLLHSYPVVVSLSVEWGDQDLFEHVNNTVYLKWCETARVIYLEQSGMWDWIKSRRAGPTLAAITCDYRRSVTFPDIVQVGARVSSIGRSSFRMEHAIVSIRQNLLAAESSSVLVFVSYDSYRSLSLPAELRQAMERLEGKPLPRSRN